MFRLDCIAHRERSRLEEGPSAPIRGWSNHQDKLAVIQANDRVRVKRLAQAPTGFPDLAGLRSKLATLDFNGKRLALEALAVRIEAFRTGEARRAVLTATLPPSIPIPALNLDRSGRGRSPVGFGFRCRGRVGPTWKVDRSPGAGHSLLWLMGA